MSTSLYQPADLVGQVVQDLGSLPACVAGSVVAAEAYDLPVGDNSDIDVFCYTPEVMISAATRLRFLDYEVSERMERAWVRFLRYGLRSWHTNSFKLTHPTTGVEVNLVYKQSNKQPLSSLSAVLESFDFGLLGVGYDLELGVRQDLRPFLFPGEDIDGPLPLMPLRRGDWRGGFISKYHGLREMGRYAKYMKYGHDMSRVREDLALGYRMAALYYQDRDEQDMKHLALIFQAAADKIEMDDLDALAATAKYLLDADPLDSIMRALE